VLEATYAGLRGERDRLRSARGFFARPLGPAPASAGISTALVSALGPNLDRGFLWAALGSLGLLVLAGVAYDGKPAYRHLYALELVGERTSGSSRFALPKNQAKLSREAAVKVLQDELLDPIEWHKTMIERERAIIGPPAVCNSYRWPWFEVTTLQDGVDVERTGLRAVQGLWLSVIVMLVLATLA
jgi:hypothetical protein